jgi:hypothetical protein
MLSIAGLEGELLTYWQTTYDASKLAPGSKKTSDSRRGCQNKLIKEAPKFKPTYLNLFII